MGANHRAGRRKLFILISAVNWVRLGARLFAATLSSRATSTRYVTGADRQQRPAGGRYPPGQRKLSARSGGTGWRASLGLPQPGVARNGGRRIDSGWASCIRDRNRQTRRILGWRAQARPGSVDRFSAISVPGRTWRPVRSSQPARWGGPCNHISGPVANEP
jgi:hypothetical protein